MFALFVLGLVSLSTKVKILNCCFFCIYVQLNGKACSPFVKKYKTIIHPGEVLTPPLQETLISAKDFLMWCNPSWLAGQQNQGTATK